MKPGEQERHTKSETDSKDDAAVKTLEETASERPLDFVSAHDDEPATEMIFPESLPEGC